MLLYALYHLPVLYHCDFSPSGHTVSNVIFPSASDLWSYSYGHHLGNTLAGEDPLEGMGSQEVIRDYCIPNSCPEEVLDVMRVFCKEVCRRDFRYSR